MYATSAYAAKLLVGNKTDVGAREVGRDEGVAFARAQGMMYIETSAKTRAGVAQAFDEIVDKILDSPELLESTARRPGLASLDADSVQRDDALCSYC